jgi:hypothetical protein
VDLVARLCHARSWAHKYDSRWVICTGTRTCKRAVHKEKIEKGGMGKLGFYAAVYNNGEAQGRCARRHSDEREGGAGMSGTPSRSQPGFGG